MSLNSCGTQPRRLVGHTNLPAAADWCMAGKCLDDLSMTSLSPNPAPDPSEEACSAEGNCDIDRVARPFIRSSKRKNSIQMHFKFQYNSQYFQHPSPSSESTPKLCIHSDYIRRILPITNSKTEKFKTFKLKSSKTHIE